MVHSMFRQVVQTAAAYSTDLSARPMQCDELGPAWDPTCGIQAALERDPDVSGGQRRCVVHAVSDHRDHTPCRLERLDGLELVGG